MEHIKKRLIFYFYTFNDFMNNPAIKIHLKCLKYYSHVFDEALFIISIDDKNNSKLIFDTEIELLKLGFNNIQFKIHKNNAYCEAEPFYNEIVSKLKTLDGLTFFGHTKGVTNVLNPSCVIESINAWILGMYYLNLEFIDEVEKSLLYEPYRFYGAFLCDATQSVLKQYLYAGTFYWINCSAIYNDVIKGNHSLPCCIDGRGFAEEFPGLLYNWNNGTQGLYSHDNRILYEFDFYCYTHERILFLIQNDINRYENFKKNIIG